MELRIKDVLKEKGIAIKELALMIDLATPNLSNLINGKSKPSIDVFDRIATALNVPISELFEQPATDVITCPNCGKRFKMEE
ncbi:MAG: helix-turn-helix transcriptional regulator [Tannerella sp.]|jgi:transcriptional regulator with XRE-family HTH domain|nr:helix-turn-helix transcriptional regulator [Tannerella sp.]